MINATVLPSGDLLVTAGNTTRQFIAEAFAEGRHYWSIFVDLFESYACNGSFNPFDAGEANPFVGLTSAPCIAETLETDEDGRHEIIGNLWWYPNYCLTDPLNDLKYRGRTIFTLAPEST